MNLEKTTRPTKAEGEKTRKKKEKKKVLHLFDLGEESGQK